MKHKSGILLRLNIYYGIFLAILFIAVADIFFSREFKVGFQEGFQVGLEACQPNHLKTELHLKIPLERKAGKYQIPVNCQVDSNILISTRITEIDAMIKGAYSPLYSTLKDLLQTLGVLCYLIIVIILTLILSSIRKSIKKGNIFSRNNIKLIRTIAILIISSSLLITLGRYLEIQQMTQLLAGTEWKPVWDGINYKEIILGLIILIIGEIFVFGYDLKEEQKLTI
ncbi:DUF2975 domain-containing protein [Odoribacter lunatus]|uniref:DUF2975 domain-containing protein n=1 Tax=Odoribacter lunatus TaxID=2941335 RepID=UPI00203F7A0E|nr:DUF2975 domain-containing protein [Odoribacter lunatus]